MKYASIIPLLFFTVSLVSCQSKPSRPADGVTSPAQENISLLLAPGTPVQGSMPDFTWKDAKGNVVSFAEVSKGRPVLVNVWATWCGPCVRETPDLVELYHELKDRNALFIGISADQGEEAIELVKEFTAKFNVPYQIVIDPDGELQQAMGGIRGYPTTFYLDKNGKIVSTLLGLQSKEKFAEEFKKVL